MYFILVECLHYHKNSMDLDTAIVPFIALVMDFSTRVWLLKLTT